MRMRTYLAQMFQHLKSSLKGNAWRIITNLPRTDQNYPITYNAVITRYANKWRLATLHFSEIFTYDKPSKPSFQAHQNFVPVHLNAVNTLKQLNIVLTDFLLFSLAYENLDASTRSMFENSLKTDGIPTYDQLIT